MYKQIGKIKVKLLQQGYKKDIPIDKFGLILMLEYGMKKNTAIEWIRLFEEGKLITVNKGVVNFR